MDSIQSLLAATDFSDDGNNAVARAGQIAADHRAALALMHVMSGPSLASLRELFQDAVAAEAKLVAEIGRALEQQAAVLRNAHGVNVNTRVEIAAVLPTILSAAQQADLLVMGAHGTNPLRDVILGTTAERLLGKCPCPALVVKRAPQGGYRRVVVPVDFSPNSLAALDIASMLAPQASIQLCHAFEVPFEGKLWIAGVSEAQIHGYRVQARQQALARLREAAGRTRLGGSRHPTPVVELGDAARVILNTAANHDADLIAIGKHGRSAIEELILGGVTRHVLADATCDVLVVNEKVPA